MNVEEAPSLPLTRMLVLMEAYTPEDVERAAAGLPQDVRTVLHRALRRAPEERHATAGELRDALRACLVQEEARRGGVYRRAEVAEELARLISDASAARDVVDLDDEGLFPSGLEEYELTAPPGDTTDA